MTRLPGLRALTSAVVGLSLVLGGGWAPVATGSVARAGTPECFDGWLPADRTGLTLMAVEALPDGSALVVGSRNTSEDDRQSTGLRWNGTAWTDSGGPRTAGSHALMGVSSAGAGAFWTVGFRQPAKSAYAFAARWKAGGWTVDSPPRPARGGEALIAVDTDPTGGVWAVGVSAVPGPVRRGIAWRRTAGGWRRQALGLPGGTALTAVLALARDDVWAAGGRLVGGRTRPLMLHWDGSAWRSVALPAMGGEIVLTGLDGTTHGTIWAVGWRVVDGVERPLVLSRIEGAWAEMEPPALGGAFSMLLDVSIDAAGRPWVAGTSYRDTTDRFVAVVASLGVKGWRVRPMATDVARWAAAIDGDPLVDGWVIGRAPGGSFQRQACEAVVGPEPGGANGRTGSGGRWGPSGRPLDHDIGELLPRPRPGLRDVPALPRAVEPTSLRVRDIADDVGLGASVPTHGASIADLDGDGRLDLFLSHHARLPTVWLRRGGRYELQPPGAFRKIDRHDCAVGRLDPGPKPDVVCSVGGEGGVGIKANELWLDIGDGAVTEVGAARGIADPVGRGRKIAIFDADGDGDRDLFVGNVALRYDGLPSPNRLYRNDGTGHFTPDAAAGLSGDRGATCALPRDLDRDGDLDLVICGYSGGIVPSSGIVIHRNAGGRFRDVTRSLGVRSIGEVDADVGQLGGSSRPDLVQLSLDRLRVSLWRDGRYVPVYERSVVHGRGVALGDVNGDGATDIYLLLGQRSVNDPDVVLLNDGTGRRFTPIAVPSTDKGNPEDVIAFDHDGNGLTDFLVLNGWMMAGPVQLITFSRAQGGDAGP